MRKYAMAFIALLFVVFTQAQTDRGDWMVGGGVELNAAKNKTVFVFNPNVGWFVSNNFAIGAQSSFSYLKLGDNRINTYGAGPYLRYYFKTKNVKPFIHTDADFQTNRIKNNTITTTENAFSIFLGIGAAFFINENLAFEPRIGYRYTDLKDASGNGGLGLNLGFQVYINRHQAERARSSIQGN